MSNIKNGGLDQYGAEPFKQQQFRTDGVGGVSIISVAIINNSIYCDYYYDITENCIMLYQDLQDRQETLELQVIRDYRVVQVHKEPLDTPGHEVQLEPLEHQDQLIQGYKDNRDQLELLDLRDLLVHRVSWVEQVL